MVFTNVATIAVLLIVGKKRVMIRKMKRKIHYGRTAQKSISYESFYFTCLGASNHIDRENLRNPMSCRSYEAFTERRGKVSGANVCEFPNVQVASNDY